MYQYNTNLYMSSSDILVTKTKTKSFTKTKVKQMKCVFAWNWTEMYFCSQVSVIIKHFDCEKLNWLFVIHNLQ